MDKLPFFYYDILSRMIPGGAVLGMLLLIQDKTSSWQNVLVDDKQNWKTIVVPLVFAGFSYLIGVVCEAVDSFPLIESVISKSDSVAFKRAWTASSWEGETLQGWSAQQLKRLRFHLWETLTFKGGVDPGMNMVFAHCHRFQAESKMFLHLTYATMLFAGISFWSNKPRWWVWMSFIVVCVLLFLSYLRNWRRWLMTLSFSKLLHLLGGAIVSFGPEQDLKKAKGDVVLPAKSGHPS